MKVHTWHSPDNSLGGRGLGEVMGYATIYTHQETGKFNNQQMKTQQETEAKTLTLSKCCSGCLKKICLSESKLFYTRVKTANK